MTTVDDPVCRLPDKGRIVSHSPCGVYDTLGTVKRFVDHAFTQAGKSESIRHFEQTVYWVKKLKPNADEAICIAAYAHDIARAFRFQDTEGFYKDKEMVDSGVFRDHEQEGARIMTEFLTNHRFDSLQTKRIANMIMRHEHGGDRESDLIMDADSISFLEVNAPRHIRKYRSLGIDKLQSKFKYSYDRITSTTAKRLAQPFYEATLRMLKG